MTKIYCSVCKKNIVDIQLPRNEDQEEVSFSDLKVIKVCCMNCWNKEEPKEIYQFEGQQVEVYYPHGIRAEMTTDLVPDIDTGIIVGTGNSRNSLMSKFREFGEDSWKTIKGLKNIFKRSKNNSR